MMTDEDFKRWLTFATPQLKLLVQSVEHAGRFTCKPLTHVAIRVLVAEGEDLPSLWSLPKPYRHHHIFTVMSALNVRGSRDHCEQGFLDSAGRFLTRKQALLNAQLHGQLKNGEIIGGVLTSEDLW